MKKGRKPIYDIDSLKVGQSLKMKGKLLMFKHQYLRAFNLRGSHKFIIEYLGNNDYYIKRIK